MNILEQEDIIKGLPDQALMQEAQMPSGQVPQYLVVSEIQRRSDMRKRYKAEQEQMPQGTVKDKVMQEGIMASMPPQMAMAPQMAQRMPNMPPPQMPPQGIEQAMPPQMMSGGGIVEMAPGGVLEEVLVKAPNLSEQKLEELIIDGVPATDLIQMGFTSDDISRVGSQIDPRIIREAKKVGSYFSEMFSPITSRIPDRPYTSDTSAPPSLLFDSDRADDIVRRGREARDQQVSDAKASFMGRTDIPPVDPPQEAPYRYNLRFSGFPETAGSPILDPFLAGLGDAYDRFMERSDRVAANRAEADPVAQMESIQDQNKRLGLGPRGPSGFLMRSEPPVTIDGDSTEVGDVSQSGIATAVDSDGSEAPVTGEAGGKERAGGGAEVQSDSVFGADDYRSRLEYLMSLGVDSDKEIEIPTLDYSDIREDLDRRTKSNMLFRLAEGIGKGDVASGIGGMSKVAEEAARDISKIDIAERKGQFDAATAAQKRQDSLIKTQRTLGAELMGLSDKLRLDKSVNKRAIINYYADIREGLQDELVALAQFEGSLSPESAALMRQIDRMLQDLGKEYGIELPEIDDDGTNNPAGIPGGSLNLNLPSRQPAP